MYAWHVIAYSIGGINPAIYYLMNGILLAISMVFLYKIGEILHSKFAGIATVLLYLFLDLSFILVTRISTISNISEIFFMTIAIYCLIRYYKFNESLYVWIGIISSILSFLSKEQGIIIIPAISLTYLVYTKSLTYRRFFIHLIPFFFIIYNVFVLSPDLSGGGVSITRIVEHIYYFADNIVYQLKSVMLLFICLIIGAYYYVKKILRTEIMICCAWFVAGILPVIVTSVVPMPLYLSEPSLGMVLLIGIIISESLKSTNNIKYIQYIVILGIIIQLSFVPLQIINASAHNKNMVNEQNIFRETTENIKVNIPLNSTIYYIPQEIRKEYGITQFDEVVFQKFLCMQGRCDLKVINNTNADYTVLLTDSDSMIYSKINNVSRQIGVIKISN